MAFPPNISVPELHNNPNFPGSSLPPNSESVASLVELVTFIVLTIFDLLGNTRVICIVLTMSNRKQRLNSIPIAHLSMVTIILHYIGATYMLDKHLNLNFSAGSSICAGKSFIRNVLVSVFPVNVTIINYQRCRILQPSYQGEKLLLGRCICFMWSIAFIGNLPVFAMHSTDNNGCQQILLLNSVMITSVYEVSKLVAYNIVPVLYMVHSLYLIKSKVSKYLCRSLDGAMLTDKVKRKIKKMRFLCLHTLSFVVLWLPAAVLLSLYKVFKRFSGESAGKESSLRQTSQQSSSMSHYLAIMVLVYTVYFMIHPLIHLHLNEDLSDVHWWQFKYTRGRKSDSQMDNEGNNDNTLDGKIHPPANREVSLDLSSPRGRSTFAVTSVVEHIPTESLDDEAVCPQRVEGWLRETEV